jgi:hypothetical protein
VRNRRASYFYVIDAFIASTIVLGALLVLSDRFVTGSSATQAVYTADDVLTALDSTTVRAIDSPQVRTWIAQGLVEYPDESALNQLVRFVADGQNGAGEDDAATNLTRILVAGSPPAVNIQVHVDNEEVYSRVRRPLSEADVVLSSKRIIVLRMDPWQVYEPALVEVRTWQ